MYGNPNNSIDIDVDNIIEKLLEMKDKKTLKQVNLSENEVRGLCVKSREIFLSQPILVELEAPLKVCGDIHGQYHDLLRLFEYGGFPPESNYLFLGDYVDRGQNSLETICLLLAFKIKFPENFFLLRGNHECASINRIYGFYDECKRRYNIKLWKTFTDCFNCLPVAALIDGKIFCMHGGLSPELSSLEQIQRIIRPTDIPDTGLLCDLLWSDPEKDVQGWGENERGVSYVFGPEIVSVFLKKHDLDLICRAHQVVEDGYEFFAKRQLVTLFSAPNYCGEYDNSGAMMSVDDTLMCSFQILRPSDSKTTVEPGQGRPNTPPRGGKTQSPTNCPPPKTLSGMANITHSPEWMAAKANLSSMVHCPTPIRRFAPTCRLALLKSISVPDLPSQDTILRRQRPTKSFNERQSYPSFNSVHNQNFNSPAEQKLNAERAASLDVIEDIECFEEVVPPARAGNPVIYDEEFLKIDANRSKRTILSIGRRSQIQSAFGIQEP